MTTRETKDEKARRLAEQLRANLKRRKAQARAMKGEQAAKAGIADDNG